MSDYPVDQVTADSIYAECVRLNPHYPFAKPIIHKIYHSDGTSTCTMEWDESDVAIFSEGFVEDAVLIPSIPAKRFEYGGLTLEVVAYDPARECYYVKRVPDV